jgi:hypothetical protein
VRRLVPRWLVEIAYELETVDRTASDADELAVAAVTIAADQVGIELADSSGMPGTSLPVTA